MSQEDITTTGSEIELARKRELAVQAIDVANELTETDFSLKKWMEVHQSEEAGSDTRIIADRVLRLVTAMSGESEQITSIIDRDEDSILPIAESIVLYGASTQKLESLFERNVSPNEVLGLYAVRESFEEHFGNSVSLENILLIAKKLGLTEEEMTDGDLTLSMLDQRSFIRTTKSKTGDLTHGHLTTEKIGAGHVVEQDPDGSISEGILESINENEEREGKRSVYPVATGGTYVGDKAIAIEPTEEFRRLVEEGKIKPLKPVQNN